MATKPVAAACAAFLVGAVAGCSAWAGLVENAPASPAAAATSRPAAEATPGAVSPSVAVTPPSRPAPISRRPATGVSLSIPAIGIRDLRVVPYTGEADDVAGTRIQDRGHGATPRGPRGGVEPGQIGNLIITGHRTSAGGPMRRLPQLQHGEHVLVAWGGLLYDYVVTGTMTISFRSTRDKARQSAPVPGYPGRRATRPMITLSTCATPEDRAAGNLWTDQLGNLEHRIDKVGFLAAIRR
jgi:sortase A